MDIKRTQPGQANWNRANETGAADKPSRPPEESPLGAAAGSSAFAAIQGEFRRADLSGGHWNTILQRSIDALLDSHSERAGALPAGARQKISSLLAADPIFSKRVFVYWDQHLN